MTMPITKTKPYGKRPRTKLPDPKSFRSFLGLMLPHSLKMMVAIQSTGYTHTHTHRGAGRREREGLRERE